MPSPEDERPMVVLEDAKIARTIRRVSQPLMWGAPQAAFTFNRPGTAPFGELPDNEEE